MSEEAAIGQTLMRLPRAADYFAVPTAVCTPTLPITDPDAGRCPVLRRKNKEGALTLARMPDAGMPLSRWAKRITEPELERLTRHLLKGMVLYQSAGIVHNDIHWGNVLVDRAGVGRYIDFGQSYRLTDLKVWEDMRLGARFRSEYIWMAPELQALRIRAAGGGAAPAADRLYAKTPEYRQLETEYPGRRSLRTVLQEFPGRVDDEEAVLAYMRRGGALRIDWWRLGVCLWTLWRKTGRASAALRQVIGGLTEFDPTVRMSPAAGLRLLGHGHGHRQTQKRRATATARRHTYSRSYIERRR